MGLSDYFGRFWFAAEPIFGVVMTLVFLSILRNQALYAYPVLLDRVITMVIGAAISCCIAWGIVDGIFYAWENHSLASRKNLAVSYAKDPKQRDKSLEMIEEDLEDSHVSILEDADKKAVSDKIVTSLASMESKEKVPFKDDAITIVADMGLNLGACLVIVLPLILFRNVFGIFQLVNFAVLIAIVLMFFIGAWTETRKNRLLKIRKGFIYAILGVIITVLTYILGG